MSMNKLSLFISLFLFVNFLTASSPVILPGLSYPFDILIHEDRIFVSENESVKIYSLKDFKKITEFGQRGEGPSEFMVLNDWSVIVNIHPKEIVCGSLGKISVFSENGTLKRTIKPAPYSIVPQRESIGFLDGRYIGLRNIRSEERSEYAAAFYNSDFQVLRDFYHFDAIIWQRGKKYDPIRNTQYFRKIIVYKTQIFINPQNEKGDILVFDHSGQLLYSISHEYNRLKFTDQDLKDWLADFTSERFKSVLHQLKDRWTFPEYFPAWQKFQVCDDRIYLQSYLRNDAEGKNKFYILDLKGEILKELELPLLEVYAFTPFPYTINQGKLYQLIENEESEEWELHITEIDK